MSLVVLYCTFPSLDAASAAARVLVEERRIACANLLPGVHSIYRWQGAIQAEPEVVLVAKTTETALPGAVRRLESLHPYQTPCITWFPLAGASAGFAAWVAQETADPSPLS
jgi:periplasmic divalent cation tolerance protein